MIILNLMPGLNYAYPADVSGVERLSVIDESLEALRKTASLTEVSFLHSYKQNF